MTYKDMLGRRSELLKRSIGNLLLKENMYGLSGQESSFYQNMIKELHQTQYELNSIRKHS